MSSYYTNNYVRRVSHFLRQNYQWHIVFIFYNTLFILPSLSCNDVIMFVEIIYKIRLKHFEDWECPIHYFKNIVSNVQNLFF